jgi:hypothetical protein
MVETKYKDHRNHIHANKERPNVVEGMGIMSLITGVALALLTVAQRIAMGYYAVGLILVGLGSALMFYRLLRGDDSSD